MSVWNIKKRARIEPIVVSEILSRDEMGIEILDTAGRKHYVDYEDNAKLGGIKVGLKIEAMLQEAIVQIKAVN